jgi:hypothetical protein
MAITIQLPPKIEEELRRDIFDLDQAAKESMLVGLYRQKRLTHGQLAQSLGLDRFETEDLLHRHNVTEDLGTLEDYLSDARTLENLRRSGR